jgi:ABC-type transporter MlaC component
MPTILASGRAVAVAVGLVLPGGPAQAADAAVQTFVRQVNAVVASVEPGNRAAIETACGRLVAQAFDVPAMAPEIAGEAWRRMNAAERQAYQRGLAGKAATECVAHGNEMAGNTLDLVGVRKGDSGDRLVAVRQSQGRGRTVIWRVRAREGGSLKAIDMMVDGRSLAAAARRDARDVLERTGGDVTALIRSVGG